MVTDYVESFCHYLPGAALDEFVGEWVLKALEPASLELSLQASEHLEKEREELDGLWHKHLERAAYQADRAGRHYRLIEPENRLAARQLAREWEEKLEAQKTLQEDYRRFVAEQPRVFRRPSARTSLGWRGTYPHCGTLRARRWPSARR
jgi:hypothetical protein